MVVNVPVVVAARTCDMEVAKPAAHGRASVCVAWVGGARGRGLDHGVHCSVESELWWRGFC